MRPVSGVAALCWWPLPALAGGPAAGGAATGLLVLLAAVILYLTHLASRQSKSTKEFYTAGNGLSGLRDGLALTGDYISAASLLGISALVYGGGFDGLIYSVGFLAGWPILLFLVADRLRNLGRYTFADVAAYRLRQGPVRLLATASTALVVLLYLIAQMVAAGQLVEMLFGLAYRWAVLAVGSLMLAYILLGGMTVNTWVQVVKAVLLLGGASLLALLVMLSVGFNVETLFLRAAQAHGEGRSILAPGGWLSEPVDALSLGAALMFGTAGLPHILIRFFTVPDARAARRSVFMATTLIGYFYVLTFVIGFGAVMLVQAPHTPFFGSQADSGLAGGANMAALYLAQAAGGDYLLALMAAVALTTILAAVAGLSLAGAAAVSHDAYAQVYRRGSANAGQIERVSRRSVLGLGLAAMLLGLLFERHNVAVIVGLAFALAASANFPVLMLSMFWRGLTSRGAVWGGSVGLLSALVLMVLGPTVWVSVLGQPQALFPYGNPALFSLPLALLTAWLLSLCDRSEQGRRDRAGFDAQYVRALTGIGHLDNEDDDAVQRSLPPR